MKTQSITSIGNIAAQLQAPVARILAVAVRFDIKPAMTINGVLHYSDDDLERIANHITHGRLSKSENV